MKISQFQGVVRKQAELAKAGVPSSKRLNLYVKSPPGSGKSECIAQVAEEIGFGFIDFRGTSTDAIDLRGLPEVRNGKMEFADPGFLPNVEKHGEFGILCIDELPQAPVSVQNVLLQLLKDDRVGDYVFPSTWIKVAAGNRDTDRAGAGRITTALGNRVIEVNLEIDHKEWCSWALRNGGHTGVIAYHQRTEGTKLSNFDAKRTINTSPRSWHYVSQIKSQGYVSVVNGEVVGRDIENELICGAITEADATEFNTYMRCWDDMPDIAAIINGQDVKCPNKPDVQFLTAVALTQAVDLENFDNIVTWMAGKMAPDFSANLVVEAMKRVKNLPKAKNFGKWAAKYGAKVMAAA